MTAASGLALATAPDVAHYFPFLAPLLDADPLAAGISTVLAPAVAATLFISIALILVNCESRSPLKGVYLRPYRGCKHPRFRIHIRRPASGLQNNFLYSDLSRHHLDYCYRRTPFFYSCLLV